MKGHHLRSSLPRFPGKKSKLWTNHGDLSFVEDRRKALEQYMKTLLRVSCISFLLGGRGLLFFSLYLDLLQFLCTDLAPS